MSMALYTRYLVELYENKGQTPMTLPAYGEGPALLDVLHEEAPAAEAEPPKVVEEIIETFEEPAAEEVSEEAAPTAETEVTEEAESPAL